MSEPIPTGDSNPNHNYLLTSERGGVVDTDTLFRFLGKTYLAAVGGIYNYFFESGDTK